MTRKELAEQILSKQTYLVVGLDTDVSKLPAHLQSHPDAVFEFNRQIIDATKDHCVGYKINTAFYEAQGLKGWEAMEKTVHHIPDSHFRIADAKRGDIGNTSKQYARAFFEVMPFDAITVAPYMGEDSVIPFLEYKDKWTILLGLTSNSGASDFELQRIGDEFLFERVIRRAMSWGSEDNLMFVVGATQVHGFETIRKIAPNHFFLVPGVGAQGGSLKDLSEKTLTADAGILVNASRAIIYASDKEDFAAEAAIIAKQYQFEMAGYLRREA
jgi:orotidine-5'-phosphate decarboxylase